MAKDSSTDITGIILVGGKSSRMGFDKAFLKINGITLFERVLLACKKVFDKIILIGDSGKRFAAYSLEVYEDIYPGSALGGLYTGLFYAKTPYIFVSACDMPYASEIMIQHIVSRTKGFDAVVPQTSEGLEPLFAVYSKKCLEPMERLLQSGNFRIFDFYPEVRTNYLAASELFRPDSLRRALLNLNTPEEVEKIDMEIKIR